MIPRTFATGAAAAAGIITSVVGAVGGTAVGEEEGLGEVTTTDGETVEVRIIAPCLTRSSRRQTGHLHDRRVATPTRRETDHHWAGPVREAIVHWKRKSRSTREVVGTKPQCHAKNILTGRIHSLSKCLPGPRLLVLVLLVLIRSGTTCRMRRQNYTSRYRWGGRQSSLPRPSSPQRPIRSHHPLPVYHHQRTLQ